MSKIYQKQCDFCDGEVNFSEGQYSAKCLHCGAVITRPKTEVEEALQWLKKAEQDYRDGNFSEAERSYASACEKSPKEHEAWWGRVLCQYGVVHVQVDEKNVITCRRTSSQPILENSNYINAMLYAPEEIKEHRQKEAEYINDIQKNIQRLVNNTEPYDIFLCYKETDERKVQTEDAKIARKIYADLSKKYNVFFAPETLRNKLGANYEANIYVAIELAKVMLVLTTKKEYTDSTWVRSEWKRFLDKEKEQEQKVLIPIFRNDADLPSEFRGNQGLKIDAPNLLRELDDKLIDFFPPTCPECDAKLEAFDKKDGVGLCKVHKWVSPKGFGNEEKAKRRNEVCPWCGNPLEKCNGHIGFCKKHDAFVSYMGNEYEKDAEEKTEDYRRSKQLCPNCSTLMKKFNGHIGFCPKDRKWFSPKGLGFEEEAANRNKIARRNKIIVSAAIFVTAVIVFFVLIRPGMQYNQAAAKFAVGNYEEARNEYSALGNYKDSYARVHLCEAMLDLKAGNTEATLEKLEQLTADGSEELTRQLSDALLPVMAGWKERGLTPQVLLRLIAKGDIIDLEHTLNLEELKNEAHKAIATTEGAIDSKIDNVFGDEEKELIVLNPDYSVTVYRMAEDQNVRLAADPGVLSACALQFGQKYTETDLDVAVSCFQEAIKQERNETTAKALTEAYQARALQKENEGKTENAVSDAKKALDTADSTEAFSFFYDIYLRMCKSETDSAEAITKWDQFDAENRAHLVRFNAVEKWKADAAYFHLLRASELAGKKSVACADELLAAHELGTDVQNAIADAEKQFNVGLSLAKLRLLEIEIYGQDERKKEEIYETLASEVLTALSEWKERGVDPAEVPALIRLADLQGISLTELNRDGIFEEAALAASGEFGQHIFSDWDGDGYPELLILRNDGTLALYRIGDTWEQASQWNTDMEGCTMAVPNEDVPLILALSQGKDELQSIAITEEGLQLLFQEIEIERYNREDAIVSFSKSLPGTITRYKDFVYAVNNLDERPMFEGIDWQGKDYPMPTKPEEAVMRYFESVLYRIPEESAVLTASPELIPAGFDAETLQRMPMPDLSDAINLQIYFSSGKKNLFEVTYPSKGQNIRVWIATVYENGWKTAGASESFGLTDDMQNMDVSSPLLCVNQETEGQLAEKGEKIIYRVIIPSSGRFSLSWQFGAKKSSTSSHQVVFAKDTENGDTVFDYTLSPNTAIQQSKDQLISPGIYYLTVNCLASTDQPYYLTLSLEEKDHIETEKNDSPQKAMPIELETTYTGILSAQKDEDYYSFTLETPGAVSMTFSTPGKGSKSTAFICSVLDENDNTQLTTMEVPGNKETITSSNLYLSAGSYLVRIVKGMTFISDEYNLIIHSWQNEVMEAEPNDLKERATRVPTNQEIHASFAREGDVDYYSFILDHDALVQPKLAFQPTDSSSKTYVLTVLDSAQNQLLKTNIGGREYEKVIWPLALPAGTYMIKVENPRFVAQDYTLAIATEEIESAEKEPNDATALATDLALGQALKGILSTDGDIDYYKIEFAKQSIVMLKFEFTPVTSNNTAFILTIEKNGETKWTSNIKGNSGGGEAQLQFDAGTYYIRVKPSTWTGAIYTISIHE